MRLANLPGETQISTTGDCQSETVVTAITRTATFQSNDNLVSR
jgi:hypothetical protein